MESTWIELVKQCPYIACLMIVVWFFLNYMKDMSTRHSDTMKSITEDFHRNYKELYADATGTLLKNSLALDRNTEALGMAGSYFRKNNPNGQV